MSDHAEVLREIDRLLLGADYVGARTVDRIQELIKDRREAGEFIARLRGFVALGATLSFDELIDVMTRPWRFEPTAAGVNGLPQALRDYIHDLETRCDPAGDTAGRIMAEDARDALAVHIDALHSLLGAYWRWGYRPHPKCLRDGHDYASTSKDGRMTVECLRCEVTPAVAEGIEHDTTEGNKPWRPSFSKPKGVEGL